MNDSPFRIYVDRDCALCVQLGHFTRKFAGDSIDVAYWQTDHPAGIAGAPASELVATDGTAEWRGAAAWTEILVRYPGLKRIGWIADRLGLAPHMGKALSRTGKGLRRFCWRCPASVRRRT